MNESHTKLNIAPTLKPIKEQNEFSYENSQVLSKDTLNALEELGDVLRGIHRRMVFERYEIVDGNIRKVVPQNVNIYEKV